MPSSRALVPYTKGASMRQSMALTVSRPMRNDVVQHCAAMLRGSSYAGPELPCTHARPFREVTVTWTFRPNMSADGTYAGVVFNPHAMFTDSLPFHSSYAVDGTADYTSKLPSAYQLTVSNSLGPGFNLGPQGFPYGTPNGIGQFEGTVAQLSTAPETALAGDVRFVGGHFCFKTFETWNNTGGQLFFVHNPQGRSLINYSLSPGLITSTTTGINFQGANVNTVTSSRYATAMLPVTQAPICGSILPHTTEFETLNTGIGASLSGSSFGAGTAGANAPLIDTIEQMRVWVPDNIAEAAHYGWNQAIVYQPANAHGASTPANCEIQFTMHYHVNVQAQNPSVATTWGVAGQTYTTSNGVSDARMASAIQSTIDGIKQARITNPQSAFSSVTQKDSIASHLPNILGTVAKAAPDIAQGIADLLPKGSLPQRIAQGVATVGHTLCG